MQVVRIGLDLAKYVFEVHGVDGQGKICEAVGRPTMRFVPPKSPEQLDAMLGQDAAYLIYELCPASHQALANPLHGWDLYRSSDQVADDTDCSALANAAIVIYAR